MTKISRDEIIKIARISAISIEEHEVEQLRQHIEGVLSYAERVKEIAKAIEEPSNKNINVFREDVVVKFDYRLIMSQAPQEESNYYVVPSILEKK